MNNSSITASILLFCIGCESSKSELSVYNLSPLFGPEPTKISTLITKNVPTKTIDYERTMARIEAKRTAEYAKWNQPINQKYNIYLFEIGPLKSKIWIYADGRYAMRRPDKLMGTWKVSENIMTIQSHRGETWVFKPLPSGTYEAKNQKDIHLIPIQK